MPAEAHPPCCRSRSYPNREQGDHEWREVGQEVSRVRGDGEAVGQHSANDLDNHEEKAKDAGYDQFPAGFLVYPTPLLLRMAMQFWNRNNLSDFF